MSAVLIVWCADCDDEGREYPTKLGWLDDENYWHQPRGRRALKQQERRLSDNGRREVYRSARPTAPQSVIRATLELRGHQLPPKRSLEWLPVRCPRHGSGSVATRDVVGKRGSVELHIRKATGA